MGYFVVVTFVFPGKLSTGKGPKAEWLFLKEKSGRRHTVTQDYRFRSGLAVLSQVLLTFRTCYVVFTTWIGSAAFPLRHSNTVLPFKWLAESPRACWLRARTACEHTNAWSHLRLRHLFYQETTSWLQTEKAGASSPLSLNFHLPLSWSALVTVRHFVLPGYIFSACTSLEKGFEMLLGLTVWSAVLTPEPKC